MSGKICQMEECHCLFMVHVRLGKTFEMREFGSLYYKNTIYVNFETDERIGKYFETDIHADHVIAVLGKILSGKDCT